MPRKRDKLTLTLITTEACNLACTYCYVHDDKSAGVMSKEVVDKTIEMARNHLSKKEYKTVSIDIFGGEPMLVWDRISKYIFDEALKLEREFPGQVHCPVFTNATLLTQEIVDYVEESGFSRLNFSLDGCKEAQDITRIYKDGTGTFDIVMEKMKLMEKHRNKDRLVFKSVISPDNVDYMRQTAEELLELGYKRISFGLARDDIWSPEDIKRYKISLKELADFFIHNINKGVSYDILMIPILDKDYNKHDSAYCSAGSSFYAISPKGDIYPCQRFFNNGSPYKLGDVFNGIDEKSPFTILFKNYNLSNLVGCNKCEQFKKFNCSYGSCIAANYESSKNIFKPIQSVCELNKITKKMSEEVYKELKGHPLYERMLNPDKYGG